MYVYIYMYIYIYIFHLCAVLPCDSGVAVSVPVVALQVPHARRTDDVGEGDPPGPCAEVL